MMMIMTMGMVPDADGKMMVMMLVMVTRWQPSAFVEH